MSKYLPTTLTTSPHLKKRMDVPMVMRHVVYALLPIAGFAIYAFGLSALAVLVTTVAGCLIAEFAYNQFVGRDQTLRDGSAVVSGLLLGLTLPPSFPLWMAFVGAVVSILVGKMIFGGLGYNPFNPALVGRAFLQTSFPASITSWSSAFAPHRFSEFLNTTLTFPLMKPAKLVDAVSGATPLAAFKFEAASTAWQQLALGMTSGSLGETHAILILACGLYLALRGMLDWRIPVSVFAGAGLFSGILYLIDAGSYPHPLFALTSGGLMLGAVFMATDMVTSPVAALAVWAYGLFIGVLVIVIRIWGGLPEGVMYVILLANAITPLLGRWFVPKVYGTASLQKNGRKA